MWQIEGRWTRRWNDSLQQATTLNRDFAGQTQIDILDEKIDKTEVIASHRRRLKIDVYSFGSQHRKFHVRTRASLPRSRPYINQLGDYLNSRMSLVLVAVRIIDRLEETATDSKLMTRELQATEAHA